MVWLFFFSPFPNMGMEALPDCRLQQTFFFFFLPPKQSKLAINKNQTKTKFDRLERQSDVNVRVGEKWVSSNKSDFHMQICQRCCRFIPTVIRSVVCSFFFPPSTWYRSISLFFSSSDAAPIAETGNQMSRRLHVNDTCSRPSNCFPSVEEEKEMFSRALSSSFPCLGAWEGGFFKD